MAATCGPANALPAVGANVALALAHDADPLEAGLLVGSDGRCVRHASRIAHLGPATKAPSRLPTLYALQQGQFQAEWWPGEIEPTPS